MMLREFQPRFHELYFARSSLVGHSIDSFSSQLYSGPDAPCLSPGTLNARCLRSASFPSHPSPSKRAIVRYLDHADRRIRRYVSAKRKLIALLEEEKQAVVNRAVTRGLDPNVRLKPSGVEWLGDVPEHWEVYSRCPATGRQKISGEAMNW